MKMARQDQHVSSISSTWVPYSASLQPFWRHPRMPIRIILVFLLTNRHSQFGTFQSKFQQNFFELSLPQKPSNWMSVQVSFKRSHWIYNVCPRFGSFMSWKTYPYVWTCCLRNFEQFGSVLQFYLSVKQILHQLLVHHSLVVLMWHPLLLRQSICDADEPCAVNTA